MEIGLPFSFHVLSMHGSFHLNASLMKKKFFVSSQKINHLKSSQKEVKYKLFKTVV